MAFFMSTTKYCIVIHISRLRPGKKQNMVCFKGVLDVSSDIIRAILVPLMAH